MPVIKRLIEPIHCSRAPIPKGVKNDLEAVCVNTLSGVILQLSSVAKHAEGIFAEIFIEATNLHLRTCSVQQRLDQLAIKVTKLDSAGEEISLQEINLKKPFKMTIQSDQQVLSRQTLPEAMMESYARCHPVPNLALLTKYRHDGKDALKFYTDPSYFFELWKQKMNVEFEKRRRKKRREQRGKKRDTEKKVVKGVKKKELAKNIPDWEIQGRKESGNAQSEPPPIHVDEDVSPTRSTGSANTSLSPRTLSVKRGSNASSIGRPMAAPPPPPTGSPAKPPPPPPLLENQHAQSHIKPISLPPPPPPPPDIVGQQITPPSSYAGDTVLTDAAHQPIGNPPPAPPLPAVGGQSGPLPPPPPPGAPPVPGAPAPPAPPGAPPPPISAPALSSSIIQNVVLSAPKPAAAPVSDPRNDLLTAIRDGMNLRKAVQITKEERQVGMGNDVASILSRRIALEFSESEGDSEYSDDGEWSDD